VKFINNIKEGIGRKILKIKTKSLERNKQAFSFDKARTAGILLNAKDVKTFELTQTFIKFIRSKDIETLSFGYVDDEKVISAYDYQIGMDHFTKKQLNWYNKPIGLSIEQFISKEFDILIDLTLDEFFPVQYIVGISRAKFKVGRFISDNSYYDMMIDIEKKNTLEYLIEQITHYLLLINPK